MPLQDGVPMATAVPCGPALAVTTVHRLLCKMRGATKQADVAVKGEIRGGAWARGINNEVPLDSAFRCSVSSKGLRERYGCDSKHSFGFDNDIMHS